MAHVSDIGVHPVKALDRQRVESARITDGGSVEYDRRYALYDHERGQPVNGIERDRVHQLETSFDIETETLTVRSAADARRFDLRAERAAAAGWFSEYLSVPVSIRRDSTNGFVSRPDAGPSVIAAATLDEVASWFDDLTAADLRRRIRVNVVIDGVPAFWEDRFVGEDPPAFEAGGIRFEGVEPCERCVIPERDPDTGERSTDFRTTFIERRQETFPDWADRAAFPHYYALMLIARIPAEDCGRTLSVGDEVTVLEG